MALLVEFICLTILKMKQIFAKQLQIKEKGQNTIFWPANGVGSTFLIVKIHNSAFRNQNKVLLMRLVTSKHEFVTSSSEKNITLQQPHHMCEIRVYVCVCLCLCVFIFLKKGVSFKKYQKEKVIFLKIQTLKNLKLIGWGCLL